MRLRLTHPHLVDDLVGFLQRMGVNAHECGYGVVCAEGTDVVLEAQLRLYVQVWQATRPGVAVAVEASERLPARELAQAGVSSLAMDERLERQARNESLIRAVNDEIAALDERATGWAAPEQQFTFQCECGRNDGCDGVVLMTLEEYERVRDQRDRFAVAPGHESSEIERVVERADRYVIVDKRDEVERFVQ